MEAYVHGISTRKVDDLVAALGVASGISRSEVSRICSELDGDLDAFRNRPLDHVEFPYVFADATYIKGRVNGRVVSRAVVVATGVTANGDREVLGVAVGDSENGAFWTAFFQDLRARGLTGVQLVISDHHLGLKAAIASVFIGSAWQRCGVHFMRNVRGQSWAAPADSRLRPEKDPSDVAWMVGASGKASTRSIGGRRPPRGRRPDRWSVSRRPLRLGRWARGTTSHRVRCLRPESDAHTMFHVEPCAVIVGA